MKRPAAAPGFLERTIEQLLAAMELSLAAENSAASAGLLQHLDPRVKLAGLLGLIFAVTVAAHLWVVGAILALAVFLAALSHISIPTLALRVWIGVFTFTGAIALPAVFFTPGAPIWRVPGVGWTASAQGVLSAAFLISRATCAATLALLLVFTTPWTHVLKALRMFRVPVVFVAMLGMTCRYIVVLLEASQEMFESRRSRTVGKLTPTDRRRMAIASVGVLLNRTFQLSDEVYLAMQARGFNGEIYVLDDFRMKTRDWAALSAFAVASGMAIWAGR